jgi:DNA sulfur modification protein DndB
MDALGFLRLSGSEKIFAIDGQHRLAGIKKALSDGLDVANEQVSVLFVGHHRTPAGLQRTRRLFTTLNKTAIPVQKRDIIALDEDDVMAITARRLVETNPSFRDPKIAVIATANIPPMNRTCLTTIAGLYDVLKLIFEFKSGKRGDRSLRFNRPSDNRLDDYYSFAVDYFDALGRAFRPVSEVLAAKNPRLVTEKHRGSHGGHLLFRPLGLELFTRTAIDVAAARKIALCEAVSELRSLPTNLARPPYRGTIWDSGRSKMIVSGKSVARDVLLYMVGLKSRVPVAKVYARALGEPLTTVKLPRPLS